MRYPPIPTREVEMLPAGEQRRKTNYMNEVKDVRFYDKEGNQRNQVLTQTRNVGRKKQSRTREGFLRKNIVVVSFFSKP